MTKSKVGAEPKKQRIRHAVTKSEGIHEGIHRDEYGYYDSSYHCYCFPLDRTTAECMENHLIHLPSGRTIEAVGTIDI